MILEGLTIENFRQYYGVQEVEFAAEPHRNITVIHGENGAGKTAFLNALTWCLYGEINLPNPNRLLNEKAEQELSEQDVVMVRVTLTFLEGLRIYTVSRYQKFIKIQGTIRPEGETELDVDCIDDDGRLKPYPRRQAENAIDQILPKRMQSYFFFDGERIDNLAKPENQEEIIEAIKNVMGLELVERSIYHLNEVRKEFQTALKKYGDAESSALVEQYERIDKELAQEVEKAKQHRRNQDALKGQIKEIEASLRSLEQAKDLQLARDKLIQRQKKLRDDLISLEKSLRGKVARSGYTPFLSEAAATASALIDQVRARGEVPSGIKEQFVDDLLTEGICICRRPLDKGSEAFDSVVAWRRRAGNTLLENTILETSGFIKRLPTSQKFISEEMTSFLSKREEIITELNEVQEHLHQVSESLKTQDYTEIQKLEERRETLFERLHKETLAEGRCEKQKEILQSDQNEIEHRITQVQQKEKKAELAQRRVQACQDARDALLEIYEMAKDHVRIDIETRVNEVFRNFLRKDFFVDLSDDYNLNIVKGCDGYKLPAAMSQGERQVASLSFIGGLVAIARERTAHKARFLKGGVYPIIMDSPFGTLDKEYRKNVARGLPDMAHQVVVLVSSSQWSEEVAKEMLPKVGSQYKLINSIKGPEYTTIEVI